MLPILINIGPVKIYTFGVFLVLAFFWGAYLMWRSLRVSSYREEDAFDGLFLSLMGGLLVSRLVYVASHFDKFGFDFSKFILINGYPGLSLYGYLAGAFGTCYLFTLSKKMKFFDFINYLISAVFLALAIGKLGSFFSGVEVGKKTKFILSIKYFGAEGLRHLTPFYESLLFFIGAYISYRLLFEIRKQKYETDFNWYFFWWYFALIYFSMDFLKGASHILLGLSFDGVVSLILLLTFSFYFLYYFRSQILSWIKTYGPKANKSIRTKTAKKA